MLPAGLAWLGCPWSGSQAGEGLGMSPELLHYPGLRWSSLPLLCDVQVRSLSPLFLQRVNMSPGRPGPGGCLAASVHVEPWEGLMFATQICSLSLPPTHPSLLPSLAPESCPGSAGGLACSWCPLCGWWVSTLHLLSISLACVDIFDPCSSLFPLILSLWVYTCFHPFTVPGLEARCSVLHVTCPVFFPGLSLLRPLPSLAHSV